MTPDPLRSAGSLGAVLILLLAAGLPAEATTTTEEGTSTTTEEGTTSSTDAEATDGTADETVGTGDDGAASGSELDDTDQVREDVDENVDEVTDTVDEVDVQGTVENATEALEDDEEEQAPSESPKERREARAGTVVRHETRETNDTDGTLISLLGKDFRRPGVDTPRATHGPPVPDDEDLGNGSAEPASEADPGALAPADEALDDARGTVEDRTDDVTRDGAWYDRLLDLAGDVLGAVATTGIQVGDGITDAAAGAASLVTDDSSETRADASSGSAGGDGGSGDLGDRAQGTPDAGGNLGDGGGSVDGGDGSAGGGVGDAGPSQDDTGVLS